MGLALIVPAYNEAPLISMFRQTLVDNSLLEFFEEVILVDDGSTDDTWFQLDALAKLDHRIRAIRHTHNLGLGASIRSGVIEARASHVVWIPVDQSFNASEVIEISARWSRDTPILFRRIIRNEPRRDLVSWIAHAAFQVLFGVDLRRQSGLFLMTRTLFLANMPMTLRAISNLEFIVRLHRANILVQSVDIQCYPRIAGKSRTFSIRSVFRSARELVGLVIIEPNLLSRKLDRIV
jgi:glycosyltransferase involved in cell wall biosynthesis